MAIRGKPDGQKKSSRHGGRREGVRAARSWNIARVILILEEGSVEYEVVAVDFATAEHKSPAHLARNVCALDYLALLCILLINI